MITDITDKLTDKYLERYSQTYDLVIHTIFKFNKRNPVKYIFNQKELQQDVYNLIDRYYRLKKYKETYRVK